MCAMFRVGTNDLWNETSLTESKGRKEAAERPRIAVESNEVL